MVARLVTKAVASFLEMGLAPVFGDEGPSPARQAPEVSDRICNHPRAFGLFPNPRGRHAKRQADPLRVDFKGTDQTKVCEWKREWGIASDRSPIPSQDAAATASPDTTLIRGPMCSGQRADLPTAADECRRACRSPTPPGNEARKRLNRHYFVRSTRAAPPDLTSASRVLRNVAVKAGLNAPSGLRSSQT